MMSGDFDKSVAAINHSVRIDQTAVNCRTVSNEFENRSGRINTLNRFILIIFRRKLRVAIRVERRVIRHRQNFAGFRINDNRHPGFGVARLHSFFQSLFNLVLNRIVNGQNYILRRLALFGFFFVIDSAEPITILPFINDRAAQNRFLRLFDSRLPDVVRIAEADDLRRQIFIRITAFLLFAPVKSAEFRQIEFFNFRRLQREVQFNRRVFVNLSRQPDKTLVILFGDPQIFGNLALFNFQNGSEFLRRRVHVFDFARVGVERFDPDAHCQSAFVAVENVAAQHPAF